jgi:hypothetical protein
MQRWKDELDRRMNGVNRGCRHFMILEPMYTLKQDGIREEHLHAFVTVSDTDNKTTVTALAALIYLFAKGESAKKSFSMGGFTHNGYEGTHIIETERKTWNEAMACSLYSGSPIAVIHIHVKSDAGQDDTPRSDTYFGFLHEFDPYTATVTNTGRIGSTTITDWIFSDELYQIVNGTEKPKTAAKESPKDETKGMLQQKFKPGDRFEYKPRSGAARKGTVLKHVRGNPNAIVVRFDDGKQQYIYDTLADRFTRIGKI